MKREVCERIIFYKQKTAYERLRSLVGSEMCIGDSSRAAFASAAAAAAATSKATTLAERMRYLSSRASWAMRSAAVLEAAERRLARLR